MKNNINILFVMFLLLLLCGCIKKETELITNNSQIEYTEITEAYLGESKELTIKGDNNLFVKLYIDGQEVAKDVNGNIRYNLSSLSLGSHNIKVECYVGDEWFEKSWTCKVVEMPVVEEYDYVDLGLPSGTLWATCNVGAKNPWDYGDYFAWGETEPKEEYNWQTYQHSNGSYDSFTKYYPGVDNLNILEPIDDAATTNMGSRWRMPTISEYGELLENCEQEYTPNYNNTGVGGFVFWDVNHKVHVFLPAAGCHDDEKTHYNSYENIVNYYGYYWAANSGGRSHLFNRGEMSISFGAGSAGFYSARYIGQSVRAVRNK